MQVSAGRARRPFSGGANSSGFFGPTATGRGAATKGDELFDEAADYVEVVRRLWDSWEDDAEIRDVAPGGSSTGRSFTTSSSPGGSSASRGRRSRPVRRRDSPRGGLAHARAVSLRCRHADVVSSRRRAHDGHHRRRGQGLRQAGRPAGGESAVVADLVVYLGESPVGRDRMRRLDGRSASRWSDALVFAERLGDRRPIEEWPGRGLDGVPATPGGIPHDLACIADALVPELRHGACSRRTAGKDAAGALRMGAACQPVRPGTGSGMRASGRQIHLAAHFPGVNNTTVWSDPERAATSSSSLRAPRPDGGARQVRLLLPRRGPPAPRARRAYLRPRRRRSPGHLHGAVGARSRDEPARPRRNHQLDVQRALRGRPAVRQPRPSLRGACCLERGHVLGCVHRRELPSRWLLPEDERYDAPGTSCTRPGRCSTPGGATRSSPTACRRVPERFAAGAFEHRDEQFDIAGRFNVPRSPQGRPVIFQAGDSDEGREFAAGHGRRHLHPPLRTGRRSGLLQRHQGPVGTLRRGRDQLVVLPAATFVLGDSDAEAESRRSSAGNR